jgi:hypothetical protein
MKITKAQLKQIIKEEAVKLQKTSILENRKKEIAKELRQLNEGEDTGNPYDLNNSDNLEEFFDKIVAVWTNYCGQNPNDAGVSNDNRVILYNLLKSGELADKINQVWPPSTLNQDKDGTDYFTNNPEDMKNHLLSLGYGEDEFTLSSGWAVRNKEEESEGSGVLNEIKTNPNGFVKALQDVAKDLNLFYNGIQGNIEKQTRIVSQQNGFPEGKDGAIAANKEFEVAIAVPEDKKDLINQAVGKLNQKISSFVSMGWDDGGEEKYKKAEGFRGSGVEKYSMPDKSWSLSAFIGPAWK